ncbi:MAG: MBL fold metallo-hydrolase [Gulosibacter sp.]|uniref:MBL fold metallo-hydrolase n=1 Tax=Gulosibacter sp. TaxID=2817531 RepID=UPI003F90B2E7
MNPAGWEIIILKHGQRTAKKSDAFLNYEWYDEEDVPYSLGYYLWVLRNGDTTIIVDTGFDRDAAVSRNREVIIDPITALESLNISLNPAALIITHAHYDHVGNVHRLKPERALISRLEYEFWTGPIASKPLFAHFAEPKEIAELQRLHSVGTLELTEDTAEVMPGVRMITVGGHTPGQCVVEVDTHQGTVLIASDAGHFHEEIERDMLFKSMSDLPTSYRVLEQIRTGDYVAVISGHDEHELSRHPSVDGELSYLASVVGGVRVGQ